MAQKKTGLLLVTAGFPYGESERSFLSEEFAQLRRQFDVSVLALWPDRQLLYDTDPQLRHENYIFPPLRSAKTLALLPRLLAKPFRAELRASGRAVSTAAYYINALHVLPLLRQRMKERDISIIYTYWCSEVTLAAVLLRRECPHLKVVTRFHGIDLYNERRDDGRQPFRTAIAEGVDRLIFPCNRARDYFLHTWGQQYAEKSVTAYLGCRPFPAVTPSSDMPLVLVSCSNLIPLKRVERIIEALALLQRDLPISWHHIGDGQEQEKLESLAQKRLTPRGVDYCFHGALPNHQLPALYTQLNPHLFLTASSTEGGVPVSIQEASSAGIPAIGTDVGGIAEIVLHEKTGYLLSTDASAQELADAITAFAALPLHKREEMSRAAVQLWQRDFNAEKNALELCRLLSAL